ncbi:MAG: TspO and MBR like proteins, partial [uncultured Gemmatimonadetes bacterium]
GCVPDTTPRSEGRQGSHRDTEAQRRPEALCLRVSRLAGRTWRTHRGAHEYDDAKQPLGRRARASPVARAELRRGRGGGRGVGGGAGLLRAARQAVVGAARLALRARVDRALFADGDGGVAGVAGARAHRGAAGAGAVRGAARLQRAVELALLRLAARRAGAGRGGSAGGADRGDDRRVLARASAGRRADGAVRAVGGVRHGAHRGGVADEPRAPL